MLTVLDGEALRRWCSAGLAALRAAQAEIDGLNVYPVPDGDTGTNLVLTMQSAQAEVDATASGGGAARVAAAMAQGALMGARGNSGVILSQLLRGFAETFDGPVGAADPAPSLQAALARGAQLAYAAVDVPVEGTVLTVAREAAAAAAEVDPSSALTVVVRAARAGAAAALATTTDLLPALRAAGVVDAGGRGLCVLLESLEAVVTGAEVPAGPEVAAATAVSRPAGHPLAAVRETGSADFAYEVQYLLRETGPDQVRLLRQRLAELGDSLVLVGGPGPGGETVHNVHVHVNDVGAALEAGLDAGRPFRVSVTRFADADGDGPPDRSDRPQGDGRPPSPSPGRAIVTVTPGPGLAGLCTAAGAVSVAGGPSACPSTGELLAAVLSTGSDEVVLLPNDGNVQAVATAAAAEARVRGRAVAVVPTRSVLQGLAALAVADSSKPFADDVAAMAAAAGSTRWAEVTVAVREAATMAGICRPGDVLGLIEGEVVLLGSDVEAVAGDLLDRMLTAGGELVTVLTGREAPVGAGERLAARATLGRAGVDAAVVDGGQPLYPFLLGVE